MDIAYIGTEYSDYIAYDDESAFTSVPAVVLYNKASKEYFAATITPSTTGATEYKFTFDAATTAQIKPGVYCLEVYADSSMEAMLYRDDEHVKFVYAAASPNSVSPESESSES